MHLTWLIKYFYFSFSLKDYSTSFLTFKLLILYWIFFGLFWFRPPFSNFTAGKSPAYDFKDIRLTNRTAGIAGWPWRWLVEIFKILPFLTTQSTPDNSNLEPKSISRGFPSYIHCNFTLGNSNPRSLESSANSNFRFPSGHFLFNFTLDNSNHILSP